MHRKLINKISSILNNPIIVTVCFILFYIPRDYAVDSKVYTLWQLSMLGVGLLYSVVYLISGSIHARWSFLSLFYLSTYLLSSFVSKSDASFSTMIYGCLRGVGFLSLCEVTYSKNEKTFVKSFATAGLIMCTLHLASVIAYFNVRGGMQAGLVETQLGSTAPTDQHWYLLTYDNESILYILPTLVACHIASISISRRWIAASICLTGSFLMTYVLQGSVSATIAVVVYLLVCAILYGILFVAHTSISVPKNSAIIVIVFGLILSIIVVLGVCSGLFSHVAILLGKDPTFSGRNYVWTKAIEHIAQNPIFGFGVETARSTYLKIAQSHCHNILLEILYSGGIVSLAFFLMGCSRFISKSSRYSNLITGVALAGLFGLLCAAIMDWSPSIPIPFTLLYFTSLTSHNQLRQAEGVLDGACEN